LLNRIKFVFLLFLLHISVDGFGQQPFISEFHYDNAGTDVNEAIEVTIPANCGCPGGLELVLYNGASGALGLVYDTDAVPFSVSAVEQYITVNYPPLGIQNGPPDGIALVCDGAVLEFLSYEGTFTAMEGPANGMTSTDILVRESNITTLPTESLQLTDAGWQSPTASSFGSLNLDRSPSTPCVVLPSFADGSVIITEIMFNPGTTEPENEWVELYNVTNTDIDLNGFTLIDNTNAYVLTGVIPANSPIIIANVSEPVFQNEWASTVNVVNVSTMSLNNVGELLEIVDPSGNTLDRVDYSAPDFPFGSEPYSIYYAVDETDLTITSYLENDIGCVWLGSYPGINGASESLSNDYGSPGVIQVNTMTESGELVITEVFYNPDISGPSEAAYEWIEVYNPSTSNPVDITDWILSISHDPSILLSGSIPPNGIAILGSASMADFETAWMTGSCYCDLTYIQLPEPMFANNSRGCSPVESIQLITSVGGLVDEVNYDSSTPWPTGTNGQSIYLDRTITQIENSGTSENNDGSFWNLSSNDSDACSSNAIGILNAGNIASPGKINGQSFIETIFTSATYQDRTVCATELPILVDGIADNDESGNSVPGTWTEIDNGGMPRTVSYTFTPDDTSCYLEYDFTVIVEVVPSAGTATGSPLTFCESDTVEQIDLEDALTGEDSGGEWSVGGSVVSFPFPLPDNQPSIIFTYTVVGGLACVGDSEDIIININETPTTTTINFN